MKLRWRLFAKYAVLIAALVSLTLIASGVTSIWFSYEENQRQLVALQREKAIGAAARIEQYVKKRDGFGLDTDTKRLVRLFFQPGLVAWAFWSTRPAK